MIPVERVHEILERLKDRSLRGEVRWTSTRALAFGRPVYSVRFQHSGVSIGFKTPTAEPDYYSISFEDSDGCPVDEVVVDEDHSLFAAAEAVYAEAHRSVTGWDKVLADVERGLKSRDMIGLPAGKRSTVADEFD